MRGKLIITIAGFILAVSALAGCATLQTVGRTTRLEDTTAIHLDAQQRLVLVTGREYCAEPSPDALSAYAAALGLGVSGVSKHAASLAHALQSSTASIGLRTQSITLMRDALYRMCEARQNNYIQDSDVAVFLRRSQELTAVVLAIEQLTGAVVGQQVSLTPDSSAVASASLVSNQQLLDQAEQTVQAREEEVAAAEKKVTEIRAEHDRAIATRDAKKKKDPEDTEEASDGREPAAEEDDTLEQAEKALQETKRKLEEAEEKLEHEKGRLKEAIAVRDAVQKYLNAALTQATAETRSSGEFSAPVQRNQLSPEATEAIAKAVTSMVHKVLEQDDTIQLCVAYLTAEKSPGRAGPDQVSALCMRLIGKRVDEDQTLKDALQTLLR